ncbi:hypothetical protein NN561_019975 [Cricetulus griseus]
MVKYPVNGTRFPPALRPSRSRNAEQVVARVQEQPECPPQAGPQTRMCRAGSRAPPLDDARRSNAAIGRHPLSHGAPSPRESFLLPQDPSLPSAGFVKAWGGGNAALWSSN